MQLRWYVSALIFVSAYTLSRLGFIPRTFEGYSKGLLVDRISRDIGAQNRVGQHTVIQTRMLCCQMKLGPGTQKINMILWGVYPYLFPLLTSR